MTCRTTISKKIDYNGNRYGYVIECTEYNIATETKDRNDDITSPTSRLSSTSHKKKYTCFICNGKRPSDTKVTEKVELEGVQMNELVLKD